MMNKKDARSDSGPQHIKEILETVLRDTGLEKQILDHGALLHWDRVAGKEISCHTKAVYVERGTLFVDVDNSVWMHRLQLMESDLLGRLNREMEGQAPGGAPLQRIRFRMTRGE